MSVSSLRSLRPACFVLGAALLAYAGCSSSGSTTIPVTHPTMIEVAPASFLGGVPCTESGPGLQTYVATLYDANDTGEGGAGGESASNAAAGAPIEATGGAGTPIEGAGGAGGDGNDDAPVRDAFTRLRGATPSDEFELPSSTPAPCSASVGFGYVVPGRRYEVLIEGYDTTDIQPRALGSHQMVAKSNPTGPLLESRWKAYCERAIPVDSIIVIADRCKSFSDE